VKKSAALPAPTAKLEPDTLDRSPDRVAEPDPLRDSSCSDEVMFCCISTGADPATEAESSV